MSVTGGPFPASGLDVRDQLTVVLAVARREGVTISDRLFNAFDKRSLPDQLRDARETLQAIEGRLSRLEVQARTQPHQRGLDL